MDPTQVTNPPGPDKKATGEPAEKETNWEQKAQELEQKLVDAEKSLERREAEHQRNVQRLQSSLTQQVNRERAARTEAEETWEERYHREKAAGMEEEEALRYENLRLADKLEQTRGEMSQMRAAAEQAQSAASYIRHFTAQGVDASRLDTTGSLQALADSGYAALEDIRAEEKAKLQAQEKQLEEYRQRIEKFEELNPDPNQLAQSKGDLPPPLIAQPGTGSAQGPRTMLEAREAAKQYFGGNMPTEEQLFRAVETKQLPPQVLPGLETLPKE